MLTTERLEIIPATLELCRAESEGREAVARTLNVRVPASWPPQVYERDDLEQLRRHLERNPDPALWTLHYLIARSPGSIGSRELVGVAGFGGLPSPAGEVVLGYAVAEEHQRRGYATEAVRGLVVAALEDSAVRVVVATTYPGLEPSIKVLLKNGFVQVSQSQDGGIIRFERRRFPA